MKTAIRARVKLSPFLAVLAIMVIAVTYAHASQGVDEAMMMVRSPEDIARFFSREFTYTLTLPDRVHTPEETLETRTGDCDDFAVLASAILARMGIESRVLIIGFKDLRMAHAVCIWKSSDGFYSFISSRKLQRTGTRTVKDAIMKVYPDCDSIASIDPQTYTRDSLASEISPAKSYRGAGLMAPLDPRMSSDI